MKFNIRADKMEVTEAISNYIEEKLGKIEKYFKDGEQIKAKILISARDQSQKIEVTIPTDNFILRNEETNKDLYQAIDLLVDKLERQIRKNKTRLISKSRRVHLDAFDVSLEDEFEEEKTSIVRRKLIELKPMDEEEAILQMNMLGHSFFVFKEANSGNICVLYLRKDGNYGLIETEC